jgi:hypothetical protein
LPFVSPPEKLRGELKFLMSELAVKIVFDVLVPTEGSILTPSIAVLAVVSAASQVSISV